MSRFFVGQRVRVVSVGSALWGFLIGKTGVLSGIGHKGDCEIQFDDGTEPPAYAMGWEVESKDIEPILPSGQVAVTLGQLLSVPGLESLDKILGAKA